MDLVRVSCLACRRSIRHEFATLTSLLTRPLIAATFLSCAVSICTADKA